MTSVATATTTEELGPSVRADWKLTPGSGLRMMSAEVRKGLLAQLSHPLGHIITLVVSTVLYLGMQYVMGQGSLRRDLLPETLVGISGYWFLQYASLVMVADLVEEKRGGTYAQSHMSPAPPSLIMLGRLVTASLIGMTVAVVATLVPMLVADVTIPLRAGALVPYALVVVNVLAFTFVLAAVALRSPMVGALHSLFTSLVILLNGSMMPLSLYPDWLAVVARLLPTTLAVEATSKMLFRDESLGDIWSDGTLAWLLAYTVALIVFGGWLFTRNQRRAVRDGRLGQY
ncbi:ABC transporter permease [Streptomyces iconiensis]|uniref:ABC transporter permease n=1 Tax=Streptomyces iconiensis TaxID=1384038 RepID=A0ABT6ZXA4_9ACTN|nr:ABC transporter permease [Streptomyces iconiensis]MDJ1133694.1 ABC transporter permease [Streptomyces iconiensis]